MGTSSTNKGQSTAQLGAILYVVLSLRWFRAPRASYFFYRQAYISIVATFGIIINETYKSKQIDPLSLLRDDNVHYILIAILWLFSPPHFGTLPPFIIYSLFHILTYVRSYILPAIGYSASSKLSTQIGTFVKEYNDRLMLVAANSELLFLFSLLFNALRFIKGSWIQFGVYFILFKLRYDTSIFSKTALKNWEVKIDSLLANPRAPSALRQYWIGFKGLISRSIGPLFKIPTRPVAAKAR